MRKAALTLLTTLVLAILVALSTGVALAGWDYEGDCPPASGKANPAAPALANWDRVEPPANWHAWGNTDPGNPGNK